MVVGDEKYVLHLVPSGVLNPGKINIIGNGVAIDPLVLIQEIDDLAARGIEVTPEALRVSATAHVIFEHHPPHLRHLAVLAAGRRKTVAVSTQDHSGVDQAALSYSSSWIEHDARLEFGLIAQLTIAPDDGSGADDHSIAQPGALADYRERADMNVPAQIDVVPQPGVR